MRKQSIFLIPLLALMFLFTSCGKTEQAVEIGKEFKVSENPVTILKLEESKILRSAKDSMIEMAPKGKKYVYLEVKNPNKEMIFLKVFSKDQELKPEFLPYHSHEVDSGFEDDYFLIDENAAIDKIVITTPSEEEFTVLKPAVTKSKLVIPDAVQKIIDSYSEQKAIGLLEGFAPYVEGGKSVQSIAMQEGSIIASNIQSNKAKLSDFTDDGKKYVFSITNVLGGRAEVTTDWKDGKITSIQVVE